MRNLGKTFLMALVMVAFSFNAFGQASATAEASAFIVTPITIANVTDMDFGNVAVSATVAGTVILSPAGVRTEGGGATLPAVTGTVSVATFDIDGTPAYTYAITLPSTDVILENAASDQLTVNTFTSNPSGTGTLDGAGEQTISVGATLNVPAGAPSGAYSTTTAGTPFTVTVNYN
jgi:hypothetical protein